MLTSMMLTSPSKPSSLSLALWFFVVLVLFKILIAIHGQLLCDFTPLLSSKLLLIVASYRSWSTQELLPIVALYVVWLLLFMTLFFWFHGFVLDIHGLFVVLLLVLVLHLLIMIFFMVFLFLFMSFCIVLIMTFYLIFLLLLMTLQVLIMAFYLIFLLLFMTLQMSIVIFYCHLAFASCGFAFANHDFGFSESGLLSNFKVLILLFVVLFFFKALDAHCGL
jgi:hypothetical protein